MTKKCSKCKKTKSTDEFSFNNGTKDGYASWCKNCDKEKSWKDQLHCCYNLIVKQYELILKTQNGVCAICKQSEIKKQFGEIRQLSVDHCHKLFKIRGLLCHNCNMLLGCAKDNPEILEAAAKYLRKI